MAEDLHCCPKLSRNIQSIKDPREVHIPREVGYLASIAVSPSGTWFVSDFSGSEIHVFSEEKEYITSFGSEGQEEGQLDYPWSVAVDSDGLVYVASRQNPRIDVFRENGTFVLRFGSGEFNQPTSIAIYNRLLYITDTDNHRISVYTLQGEHVRCIGEEGSGPGQFYSPYGVAFSPAGYMYVADCENKRVQVFTCNGHYKEEFGEGQLKNPCDILITSDGDVLIADVDNNRMAVFSPHGNTIDLVHSIAVKRPLSVAIDKGGDILVVHNADGGRLAVF